MKVKIIFINFTPMSRIFAEKVDMQWYQDNDFDVLSWDLSPLQYSQKQLDAYFSGSSDLRFEFSRHRRFNSKREVIEALQQLGKDTLVFHLSRHASPCSDDYWLLKKFRELNIPYLVQQIENVLCSSEASSLSISARLNYYTARVFNPKRWRKVLQSFTDSIKFRVNEKHYYHSEIYARPSIAVGVGNAGRIAFSPLIETGTHYVSIPSPVVNWEAINSAETGNAPIILFVDESIGHAPDAKFSGFSTTHDLASYYKNMDRLFSMLEAHFNCEVVIGASGKVQYKGKPFGENRKLVYKKTLQLAQQAKLVLGHSSSALYHCLCLNKPILLLKDPTFTEEKNGHVDTFSAGLGLPIYSTVALTTEEVQTLKTGDNEGLIERLFCESGCSGDYRRKIADAILQLMEKRDI